MSMKNYGICFSSLVDSSCISYPKRHSLGGGFEGHLRGETTLRRIGNSAPPAASTRSVASASSFRSWSGVEDTASGTAEDLEGVSSNLLAAWGLDTAYSTGALTILTPHHARVDLGGSPGSSKSSTA